MSRLCVKIGECPPEVLFTAFKLTSCFERAGERQEGESFETFLIMAGHFASPEKFPLPKSFAEMGMEGPPGELGCFFKGGVFSENTQAALIFLSGIEDTDQFSRLGVFLNLVKEELV